MSGRLPPLNALRAFEATARHLNLARAAEALGVTPGAVSHQIRQLEDYLGVRLFRRLQRGLVLTEAGESLAPGLWSGFRALEAAVEKLTAAETTGPLTVSATPALAGMWLVPRLKRFRTAHPDIDVRLDATAALVDFDRDDVDIAIRYGPGGYEGVRVERLIDHRVTPLCSPALLAEHPLDAPEDLAHHTLLHLDWQGMAGAIPSWGMWLAATGVTSIDASKGPRFTDGSLALQAAIAGHGVALVDETLAADHVNAGRLVKPFETGVEGPERFAFWVVAPPRVWDKPKIKAFREWLQAEAEHTRSGIAVDEGVVPGCDA